MAEFRQYNAKRELIVLDLVEPEDYTENVILCVPRFGWQVARSLMVHYGKWRTTYAKSFAEQFYELPDDTDFDTIEASLDAFLGARDMTCDISEGLECICNQLSELTAATYASSVSQNYAGSLEQSPGEGGEDPPAGAGAPDGGITDRKCKAAHFIIDNIQLTLFDLLTDEPPAWYEIGQVTAYLESIGLNHGFAGMLAEIYGFYSTVAELIFGATVDYEELYDDIVDNYDDIICGLANANGATEARVNFLSYLTVTDDEYDFIAAFLYNNILNILWFSVADSEALLDEWPTTVDCDACVGCVNTSVVTGTYDEVTGDFDSGYRSDINREDATIYFNWDTELLEYCGDEITLDVTEISGTPNGVKGYRFLNQLGAVVYQSASTPPPSPVSGVAFCALYNDDEPTPAPFTVNLVIT